MPYGTPGGVAALARTYTDNGLFTSNTCPTLSQVETWLEQISAVIDLALENEGFITPVPPNLTEVFRIVSVVAEAKVADLVHYANSAGRFYSKQALESGAQPVDIIRRELSSFVTLNAIGFENLGLPRRSGRSWASLEVLPYGQDRV